MRGEINYQKNVIYWIVKILISKKIIEMCRNFYKCPPPKIGGGSNFIYWVSVSKWFRTKNFSKVRSSFLTPQKYRHRHNTPPPLGGIFIDVYKERSLTHFPLEILSLEVQKIPCFWVSVHKWVFFRENISHPQGGICETKIFFTFFFIDLPNQPKERIPAICFVFWDLEVRFCDSKWKFQILISPEIPCTVVRSLTLSGQKYDF